MMIWYVKHTYVIWYVELFNNLIGYDILCDLIWYAVRFSEMMGYDAISYECMLCIPSYLFKVMWYYDYPMYDIAWHANFPICCNTK